MGLREITYARGRSCCLFSTVFGNDGTINRFHHRMETSIELVLLDLATYMPYSQNNQKERKETDMKYRFFLFFFLVSAIPLLPHDVNGPLLDAVNSGNLELVKLYLNRGADIDIMGPNGLVPLHIAVLRGNLEMVQYLLEAGARVSIRSASGFTPLMIAVNGNNEKMVDLLISYNADVNRLTRTGISPLDLSLLKGYSKVAEKLQKSGASAGEKPEIQKQEEPVKAESPVTEKPAIESVKETAESFTVESVAAESPEETAETAEATAAAKPETRKAYTLEDIKAMDLDTARERLAKGVDIDDFDQNDIPEIIQLVVENTEILEMCLSAGINANISDADGRTPLVYAVETGLRDSVKILLDQGANPDMVTGSNDTPLLLAAEYDYIPIAGLLIEAGADVNAVSSKTGDTPLMTAVRKGSLDMMKALIAMGADINTVGAENVTALMIASEIGVTTVVQYLITNGADVNAKDNEGKTPLSYAKNTVISGLLKKNGAVF